MSLTYLVTMRNASCTCSSKTASRSPIECRYNPYPELGYVVSDAGELLRRVKCATPSRGYNNTVHTYIHPCRGVLLCRACVTRKYGQDKDPPHQSPRSDGAQSAAGEGKNAGAIYFHTRTGTQSRVHVSLRKLTGPNPPVFPRRVRRRKKPCR